MSKILEHVINILFPPLCLGCKKYLSSQVLQSKICEDKPAEEKGLFICHKCNDAIEAHNSFFCPKCNRRLPSQVLLRQNLGGCHPKENFVLAAATSYQNPVVREIIHSLKYNRITAAMKPIGKIMEKYLQKIFPASRSQWSKVNGQWLVVPIPLHFQKLRERGFNQAELIAKKLIEIISPIGPISLIVNNLIRVKNTKSQTKLKKEERTANIENCFVLKNPEKIAGKNIILVDDVFTSGATMKEAVKILKSAGAKKIVGFVIAKT